MAEQLFDEPTATGPPRFEITHLGDPMPWPRAGYSIQHRKDGTPYVKVYTPTSARDRAAEFAALWREAGHGRYEAGVPLECYVVAAFARPDYHYGTGANANTVKPRHLSARPGKGGKNGAGQRTGGDEDNIGKLVKDGLSGVAYADDGQIAKSTVEKLFIDQAGVAEPQTIVEIQPL